MHRGVRIAVRAVFLGKRVDEHDRAATLQHELIDRVEQLCGEFFRVNHDQRIDIGVDFACLHIEPLHLVDFAQQRDDAPFATRRASRLRIRNIGRNRQTGHKPDHPFFRVRQVVDHFREFVFERTFPLRAQYRNRDFIIDRVRPDKSDETAFTARVHRYGLDTEPDGLVFRLGKRLRVDHEQADLAVGGGLVFLEQITDAFAVCREFRYRGELLRGEIKPQRYGFVDTAQNILRALGQRVQFCFRHIEPQPREGLVRNDVDAEKQRECDDEAGAGE